MNKYDRKSLELTAQMKKNAGGGGSRGREAGGGKGGGGGGGGAAKNALPKPAAKPIIDAESSEAEARSDAGAEGRDGRRRGRRPDGPAMTATIRDRSRGPGARRCARPKRKKRRR